MITPTRNNPETVTPQTTNLSERDEQIQLLKYDPDSFIGRSVYQRFSSQVYSGQILCTDVESKTGRTLWQILFSDNVTIMMR